MIYEMLGLCNACEHLMNYFTLAYPSVLLCVSAVWFSLLRWSSTCWWEQMRGTHVVIREVMVSLLSHLDLSTLGFLVGLWPMYQLDSYFTIFVPVDLVSVWFWHRRVLWITVRS